MSAGRTTLAHLFLDRAQRMPDRVAMRFKNNGAWETITWKQAEGRARDVAAALIATGVGKGDRVSILSANRPEWHLADWGAALAAAVPVGIYTSNSPEQVAYVAGHSEARVAFVEDADQLRKLVKVLDQLPTILRVVLMSGVPDEIDPRIVTWPEFLDAGGAYAREHEGCVDERVASLGPDDLATIVYTSGTTGPPKGAMISYANALWVAGTLQKVLGLGEGDRLVSYLPLAHILERIVSDWGSIYFGFEIWFAESIPKLADNLREAHPTILVGVPRVYEKFYTRIKEAIAGHPRRALIERAVTTGRAYIEREQSGAPIPVGLRIRHAILDRLVLGKLRHEAGLDRLHLAVSGAAPINPEIISFLRSLGLPLLEGYGMTESTAVISIPSQDRVRVGTVGPPLPATEVRLDVDGEILIRGPNVFQGYFKDEAATRDATTDDGFFRTGDVGRLDDDGYLMITDRKKDLIITAGGKNIAPQVIEEQLKLSPLISQAVLIGDQRPYISAMLTPDAEAVAKWAADRGIETTDLAALANDERLLADVGRAVDDVNAGLSHVEQVKRWTLLDHEFDQEKGELTPTIKVRRMVITQRYADQIARLYDEA